MYVKNLCWFDELVGKLPKVSGAGSSWTAGKDHDFGWRDVYDLVIRWRQISEVRLLASYH